MSLDKLAPKIARQDAEAFEELYEKLHRLVYSVCIGVVRDRGLAEDLTQETFVAVWTHAAEFRGNGFKSWILKIARNKSLNELRRRREISEDFTLNEGIGGGYTIDTAAETGIVLSAALSCLEDRDREIVLMKNAGLKTKEIAEILKMPRGTVSWRYSEALKALKNYLEGAE